MAVSPPQVEAYTPEWFALHFLREWTPQDIQVAIKKDVAVDFSMFMETVEAMVVERVLGFFRLHRPDLYLALNTKEGQEWVKKNIRRMMIQSS